MYELKKIGKVFTNKFVGTGPSSYKKRIYRAAVSQKLRKTDLRDPPEWVGLYLKTEAEASSETSPVYKN